jgi:hypothetical protein
VNVRLYTGNIIAFSLSLTHTHTHTHIGACAHTHICACALFDKPINCYDEYKSRQAVYIQHNIQAHSHTHCCNETAARITYFVCVCVCVEPEISSMQRACAVLFCHLWPVWLHCIFPHYLTDGTIKNKVIEHKMRVLIFFTTFI